MEATLSQADSLKLKDNPPFPDMASVYVYVCVHKTAISQTDPPWLADKPVLIRDQAKRRGPAHSLLLAKQPTS